MADHLARCKRHTRHPKRKTPTSSQIHFPRMSLHRVKHCRSSPCSLPPPSLVRLDAISSTQPFLILTVIPTAVIHGIPTSVACRYTVNDDASPNQTVLCIFSKSIGNSFIVAPTNNRVTIIGPLVLADRPFRSISWRSRAKMEDGNHLTTFHNDNDTRFRTPPPISAPFA